MMNNSTIHVRITSPNQILYDGDALSISSTNSIGKFDILAAHANFITLIENKQIIVRDLQKQTHSFTFPLAIIYTVKNTVNIYTYVQIQKQI